MANDTAGVNGEIYFSISRVFVEVEVHSFLLRNSSQVCELVKVLSCASPASLPANY